MPWCLHTDITKQGPQQRVLVLENRAGQVSGVRKNDLRIPKDEGAWAPGFIDCVGKTGIDRNWTFCWDKAPEPISNCLSCISQ